MTGAGAHLEPGSGAGGQGGGLIAPRGRPETAEAPTQMGPAAVFSRAIAGASQPPLPLPQRSPGTDVRVIKPDVSDGGRQQDGRHTPLLIGGILGATLLLGGMIYGAVVFAKNTVIIAEKPAPAAAASTTEQQRGGLAPALVRDDGEGAPGCIRDATQVIASERRDTLLLDAIRSFADGRYDSAQSLLTEYTQEACDRASYEALQMIAQKIAIPTRE